MCSCLTCALVFPHTTTFSIGLHVMRSALNCGLGVELPLFSDAASILHDCRSALCDQFSHLISLVVSISLIVVLCVHSF